MPYFNRYGKKIDSCELLFNMMTRRQGLIKSGENSFGDEKFSVEFGDGSSFIIFNDSSKNHSPRLICRVSAGDSYNQILSNAGPITSQIFSSGADSLIKQIQEKDSSFYDRYTSHGGITYAERTVAPRAPVLAPAPVVVAPLPAPRVVTPPTPEEIELREIIVDNLKDVLEKFKDLQLGFGSSIASEGGFNSMEMLNGGCMVSFATEFFPFEFDKKSENYVTNNISLRNVSNEILISFCEAMNPLIDQEKKRIEESHLPIRGDVRMGDSGVVSGVLGSATIRGGAGIDDSGAVYVVPASRARIPVPTAPAPSPAPSSPRGVSLDGTNITIGARLERIGEEFFAKRSGGFQSMEDDLVIYFDKSNLYVLKGRDAPITPKNKGEFADKMKELFSDSELKSICSNMEKTLGIASGRSR